MIRPEPFDADKHGHIIGDAVQACLAFGTAPITAAREQMREERVEPPADLDGILFAALEEAGAFKKGGRP